MSDLSKWPRRGTHWDVFNGDEVQSLDEGNEPPYWPDGPCFEYDEDAVAFVTTTAMEPMGEDTPDEIIRECRQAVREIVRSWAKERR